jgi:hypothetical protein
MNTAHTFNRYLYWIDDNVFGGIKSQLRDAGYRFASALKTPCEVLNATGNKLYYARPGVWSRLCVRQGSWYRDSNKAGKILLMSEQRLPQFMDAYLDATLRDSDFTPDMLPGKKELQQLVESYAYCEQRPDEWEKTGIKDSLLFKAFFTVTGFWGRGDNLRKHWLTHRANHANFLARQFTTQLDGEEVPYSISENSGVCSSCVEFFNVTAPGSRKLVRACPGSISFSRVERNQYYDVQPVQIPVTQLATP